MEKLKITLVQTNLLWEDKNQNLENFNKLLSTIPSTDLIILPEMFTTGFSMNSQLLAEPMNGHTVSWMKKKAKDLKAALTGSIIIKEEGKIYNRCLFITPDGEVFSYDKKHLYTMGSEHLHYSPGTQKLVVEYNGWRICPLICYDLRFPVWSRNQENYDLLIYMANWPSPRHHVWKNLVVARAIENQCYVAAVNRIGTDGSGLTYLGDSALVDAKGYVTSMEFKNRVKTFSISKKELLDFRSKFPLLSDKDSFSIL